MVIDSRLRGDLSGVVAASFWSFSAILGCMVMQLPLLQCVICSQGAGLIATLFQITVRRRWSVLREVPLWWWVTAMALVSLNQVSYLIAFRCAPAVQVDLINYLWPTLLLLFGPLVTRQRVPLKAWGGAFTCLAGLACLTLGNDAGTFSLEPQALFGSLSALIAALSWVGYSLLLRYNRSSPTEVTCLASSLPVFFFIGVQLLFGESWQIPDPSQLSGLILLGVASYSIAMPLWDVAVSRGHFNFVSLLGNAIPAASVSLLVLAGWAEPSWSIALACGLVTLGSVVGRYGFGWGLAEKG